MKVKAPDGAAATQLAYPGYVPPLATALDGFALRLKNDSGTSNPYLLAFARAPVVVEQGDNDTQAKAQQVPVPCEISGRIEKRDDVDWYTFAAKKGAVVAIEAFGERLGSPVDLFFQVVSAKGTAITEQDDTPETMTSYFSARQRRPAALPLRRAGRRRLLPEGIVAGCIRPMPGPRHRYLVRIGPDQPDFQVVAMPTSTLAPDAGELGQFGSYAFQRLRLAARRLHRRHPANGR